MIYILNSSILTDFGVYKYSKISQEKAKEILKANTSISAIGHEATAIFLSKLLDADIKCNRIAIAMSPGDIAIVFRLLTRLKEGEILDNIPPSSYSLGILERLE
ncbi:MAG: STIV orfB116 family protein [Thermodesulfobium sp.]